jgi:pseudaminic acid cytidylyltransferase
VKPIAIIPARAGSKRIPRKNIRPLDGIPILGRLISKLRATDLCSRIIVSTDSEEIGSIATEFGAEAPFTRPAELANDHATTRDVIAHAVREMALEHGRPILCIYPTSIMVSDHHIQTAIQMHGTNQENFVMTAQCFEHPIYRAFEIDSKSAQITKFALDAKYLVSRTQDLTQTYHDAGLLYLANAGIWLSDEGIIRAKNSCILLDRFEHIDVDNEADWALLEKLYLLQTRLEGSE